MGKIKDSCLLPVHRGMTFSGKREQEFSFCFDMNSSVYAHFLMTTHTFTRVVSYVPCYVAGVSQLARYNIALKCNISFHTVKCAGGSKRHVTGKKNHAFIWWI